MLLKKIKIWEIVELSKKKKPVGHKWVLIVKYKVDGTLERYKARFVAKGYTHMCNEPSRNLRSGNKDEYYTSIVILSN